MLGAYKEHPQAYLLYVEHLFLCSNAVDGMHIFKSTVDRLNRFSYYGKI